MTHTTDDPDRDLRRLLAETTTEPIDDAFVARVHEALARRRRRSLIGGATAAVAVAGAAVVTMPHVAPAAAYLAGLPIAHASTIGTLLVSPVGLALSALVAVVVLTRTFVEE